MSQVPKAPDPSLALSDPVRYVQEKAAHDGALEWVNSIVEKATSAKDVGNTLTQEQQTENIQSEIAKLTEAFPDIVKPEGKKKFFDSALGAAREIGFSDQELGAISDHRYFKVLHYAKLGMEAEAAKAKVAGKVANVPPVAPQKRPAGPNDAKRRANQDAMKKLAQSGSIHDAMAVDFD
jgi:Tfp pilus assembly protein PilZ